MKFPLWLHGHIVVVFLVVSIFPKNVVVQLVPGTEVAVAPKKRKKNMDSHQDVHEQISAKEQPRQKALLRVQEPDRKYLQRYQMKGIELGVMLTSTAFIHPETASHFSFKNLQPVSISSRLPLKERTQNSKDSAPHKSKLGNVKGVSAGPVASELSCKHVIVRLVFSDSAALGHLMLPWSLRLFVQAGLHSWVYVKSLSAPLTKELPVMTLSPFRFKSPKKDKPIYNNGSEVLDGYNNREGKTKPLKSSLYGADIMDWSVYDEFLSSLSFGSLKQGEDASSNCNTTKGKGCILHMWLTSQIEGISPFTGGVNVNSMILGNEMLLHFEVISLNLGNKPEGQSPDGSLENKNRTKESTAELLFLLTTTFDESSPGSSSDYYKLVLKPDNKSIDNIEGRELSVGKLDLGECVSVDSIKESSLDQNFSLTVASLNWLGTAPSDVINRLILQLSHSYGRLLSTFDLPLPGHVLIYGPPGSGKTSLVKAVAKHLEKHEEILAHIVFVSCSKLATEKSQTIRQAVTSCISEALVHAPSIVIFDDLDCIVSSDPEAPQSSNITTALVEFLADAMDEYAEKRQHSCGLGPVAFMASAQSLGSLPQLLTTAGRFDFHVQLPVPAASERGSILKHEVSKRSLQCSEDILYDVASKCDGYDAYDLETLVDRAIHAAVGRSLSCDAAYTKYESPILVKEDFTHAMHDFVPVAMRGITNSSSDGGRTGWEDVGGLREICNAIQEMIELPSKFPDIFSQAPLRLRSNVLLYGPPGCGKTHIVGAAAAACSLRFISIKGPELLNKYIGASEQAVRDLFSKAAAAAPCLLFFDEFDSIAPKRGHDNTGVTDRVVNQLLTELDGVEALTGVFVFAATSRPDLLDAALLRPGRLDRLLFCDFPSWGERLDILTVLSRKLPLANDVNLEAIASVTEGFSGADLQALLSDAQLASVHELLENEEGYKPGEMPIISNKLLRSVALRTRPSVSESEKHRLYGIYNQFLDAKKSVSAQSRDAKGKRATLA
ncbi:Peroxisome biogenesis protein 1 [Acorus gramineus]|uniref:Peroxisomal ATPase PEX1 n=1 Tax=Acorus gramineus TaxID=55184 RepID=A0AAV9BVB6_ACOGR|nr:Peroxisome biogenesis protein 1 [Acorus gramineus]